ncbi:E3 ubiquitin-protein ligase listerin [Scaptodrosophila lebanonensis]|uniref:E3 ubiquitin-protein ligase listerin n=1 Tax=Drosophila lebanonensis TaxID=7225 RepID=A0A6J2T9Y7_DROLE|nr:E3 ubiquitin-protein ligase listerin [Scaptodrosophila lebanonensis]
MGGKTKQAQRTKNNTKPSSSRRTAELLGASTTPFVSFSAFTEGLPITSGFGCVEQSLDANISPQTQIILRKLSKKDPMTKKKALQELLEVISESELDTLKSILPLWPKYYYNLANDIEHNVRELAQTVLQLLMSKCKRAMAPYLKQLVPVWLASHFDNYAPAASIACNSFRETFTGTSNRTQEVCLHCQTEILEFITRNLTFHTAATLSVGKSLTPEEAEQKLQRVVISSLRCLSFFLEHTSQAEDLTQVKQGLIALLEQNKFWSFAKNKIPAIKAAWFECVYHIILSPDLVEIVIPKKSQLITTTFQYIDDADPLVAPHVWGCVLLLQSNFDDWYTPLNIRKALLPKLSSLLRNAFNHNAQAICPNLLPFLSKITDASLQDVDLYEFYIRFFSDMKLAITEKFNPPLSKSECAVINNAYFECLRFCMQQINNNADRTTELDVFAHKLLQQQLLEPIALLLHNENGHLKFFFQHSSALMAFWDRQCVNDVDRDSLYAQLLNKFWTKVFQLVTEELETDVIDEDLLSHVLLLLQELYVANPSLETQSVKFVEASKEERSQIDPAESSKVTKKGNGSASFIQKELKQLVGKLVRICLDKASAQKSSRFVRELRTLTKMFTDVSFFESLTDQGDLHATLDKFVALLSQPNDEYCDSLVDIVFEILALQQPLDRLDYIAQKLLQLKNHRVQHLVLHRLLSYPLCAEPAIREMLTSQATCATIARIAEEVVVDGNREKLNLLHKCFFQTDTGDILINASTVDTILLTMSSPLEQAPASETVEMCGSFIAQIMPVICSNDNSSIGVRQKIFLRLYRFSLEFRSGDYLSEDTLWEITTCWQDALSSKDIEIDDMLLESCARIIQELAYVDVLGFRSVEDMSEAIAKFVICSTENIEEEAERIKRIDETIVALFTSDENSPKNIMQFEQHCVYLESLHSVVTAGVPFDCAAQDPEKISALLRRTAINFATLCKLVCRVDNAVTDQNQTVEAENELTDDYCDPNANLLLHRSEPLISELLKCVHVAVAADAWLEISLQLDRADEDLVLGLSEKLRSFLGNSSEIAGAVKDRLLQAALQQSSVINCRALSYFVHYSQYAAFEDNATILLHEDLAETLVLQKALKAYVMALQYLLPKLSQKSLGLNSAIMRTEPPDMWVKAAVFRCMLLNNFDSDLNEKSDRNIIASTLQFITSVNEQQFAQKELLHYNIEICEQPYESVLNTVEYIKLLNEVLQRFPYELTMKNWDAIRIGLGSWVLTVSKSIQNYRDPKTSFFIVAVYQLFATLVTFVRSEKQKSSTETLKTVIDEWENLFAREVNVVLFKSYYEITHDVEVEPDFRACYEALLELITPTIEFVDYGFVYAFCKSPASKKISLDHLCNFLLKQLYFKQHCVRINAVYAIRQLTSHFVADDVELNDKQTDNIDGTSALSKWHFLNRFEDYLSRYEAIIHKYLSEFNFKLTELEDLQPIDSHEAYSYLLLWECIINACAKSPVALRSIYTNWLIENKYEESFLHFLFRAMPVDILRNHGAKVHSNGVYKELSWSQLKDRKLSLERYVCHLYTEVLRKLPAVVRKWWNTSQSRQKNFVDNLTTNYVSSLICSEELKAIANRKEKHENMQVTVHTSTREVLAVYAIDEARMELVITLAPNYPLGAVKVECGKQIGGRASSRNVGMQLTIFLTHQNGTIYDGLTLWKNNLDKKFEGVEECYVCYTVIHQDTCQLPKLTCKTCKKKFHGPCLYKWFTTSSKSTCPICRNVF